MAVPLYGRKAESIQDSIGRHLAGVAPSANAILVPVQAFHIPSVWLGPEATRMPRPDGTSPIPFPQGLVQSDILFQSRVAVERTNLLLDAQPGRASEGSLDSSYPNDMANQADQKARAKSIQVAAIKAMAATIAVRSMI